MDEIKIGSLSSAPVQRRTARNPVCLGTPNYKPGESSKKGRMVARSLAGRASEENESGGVRNSITPSLLFHFAHSHDLRRCAELLIVAVSLVAVDLVPLEQCHPRAQLEGKGL